MQILMVSEDLPTPGMGGLARHVITLSQALAAAGHTVDIMGNDDFPLQETDELLCSSRNFFPDLQGQFAGWKEMQLGIFIPWKRSLLAKRFANAILQRSHHYDVVHYHGHLPNIASYIPSSVNFIQTRHDQGSDCLIHTRFTRGKICTSTDAITCAQCRSKTPNAIQRYISSLAVKQYRNEVVKGFTRHKTIFVSNQLHKNLQRCFGPSLWGMVVHNFIDEDSIQVASLSTKNRNISNQINVFIAAKLYAAKGVSQFLASLEIYPHQNVHITIAGNGPEESELIKRYSWVTFLGWLSSTETLKQASTADVVVVPSICEESCATTILEALALGKSVFALRLGGTPELVIYASQSSQLQLFENMDSLVKGLLSFTDNPIKIPSPKTISSAKQAASFLLNLYALPPGPISTIQ